MARAFRNSETSGSRSRENREKALRTADFEKPRREELGEGLDVHFHCHGAFASVRDEGTYRAYAYFDDGAGFEATAAAEATVVVRSRDEMARLYNPNSGEHLYTADAAEREGLVKLGWRYEGTGWVAPAASNTPVYRLYNGNAGEHHYTASAEERDHLVSLGWTDEGIGWYSGDDGGVAVYREYNPNEPANNHNYTASRAEHDHLVSLGWKDEGIAWYGVAVEQE